MESAIHIGIADWCEISHVHGKKYQRVLGVEAIRKSAETAKTRANHYNRQHGTDYQVLNYLITNEDDRIYEYNIASNHGHSSSIYKMKEHKEVWEDVKEVEVHKLKSKRFATIINLHALDMSQYNNLIVDVQGAELEVLKSFDDHIDNFKTIEVEISTRELYEGQVLFPELNQFLEDHGYMRTVEPHTVHQNLIYNKILNE